MLQFGHLCEYCYLQNDLSDRKNEQIHCLYLQKNILNKNIFSKKQQNLPRVVVDYSQSQQFPYIWQTCNIWMEMTFKIFATGWD